MHYPGLKEKVEKWCDEETMDPEGNIEETVVQIRTGRSTASLKVRVGNIPCSGEDPSLVLGTVMRELSMHLPSCDKYTFVEVRVKGDSNPYDSCPIPRQATQGDITDPSSMIVGLGKVATDTNKMLLERLDSRDEYVRHLVEELTEVKEKNKELEIMVIAKRMVAEASAGGESTKQALAMAEPFAKLAAMKLFMKMKRDAAKEEGKAAYEYGDDEKKESSKALDRILEAVADMLLTYDHLPNKKQAARLKGFSQNKVTK